jgi:hypothetical protein
LPNGDHHLFLAQDFRFGIIGNCVDRTICVFGQELLDAFAAEPPSIYNKPSWHAEERREMERLWAEKGWQRLSVDEKEDVWDRFDSQFEFHQRRVNPDIPAIAEPTPSMTWALAPTQTDHQAKVADLTRHLLAGFQQVTRPGERLYALDALHWYEHYTFDPYRLESAGRDSWALTVYPDNNYAIFLAADFRFGVFGNPSEQTLCVFGQELLEAMGNSLPIMFGSVVRQNAKGVSG